MVNYESIVCKAPGFRKPELHIKTLHAGDICFPVVYSSMRVNRPYKDLPPYNSSSCPLCLKVKGEPLDGLLPGYLIALNDFSVTPGHSVVYPIRHRSWITMDDIVSIIRLVEYLGDAAAVVNMYGAAATVPHHFHIQMHCLSAFGDDIFPFPASKCPTTLIHKTKHLQLSELVNYPAQGFRVHSEDPLIAAGWLMAWYTSMDYRPFNWAVFPGPEIILFPRGVETPSGWENRFGASEMLGLIAPLSQHQFDSLTEADMITSALAEAGIQDEEERNCQREKAAACCECVKGEWNG